MNKVQKIINAAKLAGVSSFMLAVSAHGGSASYDFSTDPYSDFIIVGNNAQPWHFEGGNPGEFLALTHSFDGENAVVVFPDIDPGKVVTSFKFEADLRIGNPADTDGRPADGFSVSFARGTDPVLATPDIASFPLAQPENGTATGIAVSFDTWAGNSLPDGPDVEGIIVRVDNETVLRQEMPTRNGACEDDTSLQTGPRDAAYWETGFAEPYIPESWATLCWAPLSIELTEDGKLTVIFKGRTILDAYQTEYFPSSGQLVLAGRTGGNNEHTQFDNISLVTTVSDDTTPPTAPSGLATTLNGARRVTLSWNPATDDSGRVSYLVDRDGVQVSGVLQDTTFTDTNALPVTTYSYSVRAVDAGDNSSAPITLEVTTADEVASTGFLKGEIWDGITGTTVLDLLNSADYFEAPDRVAYLNGLSFGETAFAETFGNDYGIQISGTLTVPETGDYHFFVRSDDSSAFYLNSTGSALPDPMVVNPIASEVTCCEAFKEPNPSAVEPYETTMTPITLAAGTQYGFVYIVKEGGGGDWGQVAMRRVGDTTPASQLKPITGPLVTGTADVAGGSVTITEQPADQTVPANGPVTFTVAATHESPYGASLAYQWYRDGDLIVGATSPTYTIPFVSTADNGANFTVWVGTLGANVTSEEATLTIGADTTVPTITGFRGTVDNLTVAFSEPVNEASAETLANYQVSGGATVTSATVISNPGEAGLVRVVLSGVTPTESYTATISGVTDLAGNAVASTVRNFEGYHIYADFNDGQVPYGASLAGAAANVKTSGGPDDSGFLELTANLASLQGNINFPDVTNDETLTHFTASFSLFIGRGSGNPADGFSFSIASDIQPNTSLSEEGTATGIAVVFDTYDNGGGEAPAIVVKVGGVEYAANLVSKSTIVNDRWVDVVVQVNAQGQLTLIHDNIRYYDNLDIGLLSIPSPRVNFAARTGGQYAAHWVDNIAIIYNEALGLNAPIFETAPVAVAVSQGDAAQLTAVVTGEAPITYQWQKQVDGEFVNVTNGGNITGATTATLDVSNATVSENGWYRLVASNASGSAESPAVQLKVVSPLTDVTAPTDVVTGFGPNAPAGEPAANAINDTTAKYLNFGEGENTAPFTGPAGFVVTPGMGSTIVTGLRIYTANDGVARDPSSFILEGSNDGGATYQEIAAGPLQLPVGRNAGGQPLDPLAQFTQEVHFSNGSSYTTYRVTFPDVRDAAGANSLQIAEAELLGNAGVSTEPVITVNRAQNGEITITWTNGGTLQGSPVLGEGATWTDLESDGSYTTTAQGGSMFFRVEQ